MSSKRKIFISVLIITFVLVSVIATIAVVFALTQQTIKTSLNIGYTVDDIDGTASATYTIGGVEESLLAMRDGEYIGEQLVFKASDTEDAGNLMFPEDALALTSQNDNVVIKYTYSNTGAKHYIASMSFDAELIAKNMKVEYSINGTDYSENRYAVVVPANTSNRSYWIKISIDNKAASASFSGVFSWLLSGCDPQSEEYLSLTSLEFQENGRYGEGSGAYSASVAASGSYVGELVFPSEVNGDPVTIIATSSLTDTQKQQVTSVYIPDSVTTIGESAFEGYTNLQTVTFEQNETASVSASSSTGLTTVGANAFKNCSKLDNLNIPSTVTSFNSTALTGCASLKNITANTSLAFSAIKSLAKTYKGINLIIGNSVTSIGYGAFAGCTGLTSIEIPNSVTSIGSQAFSDCTGLTSIIVEEDNTTYHSAGNCLIETESKILMQVCNTSVIPTDGSVTSIGHAAFKGFASLTEIEIPNSVTSIASSAFWGCTGLTSVVIPNSVTSIEDYAFRGCTGLTSVVIPNSVTSIGCAFYECTGLTSVTIGSGVTSIGFNIFYACTELTSITVASGNTKYHSAGNCIIETESKTLIAGCKTSVIPTDGSVTSIDLQAFIGCTGLTSITIPSSVTSIGDGAFSGCSGLTEIEIPNSVTSMGEIVFQDCTGLTSITIGSGVTSIGWSTFRGCAGLTSVVIPNSVTEIGGSVFSGCTGLTSVIFENKTGWKADSIAITESQLNDPANAASLLTDENKYCYYCWIRTDSAN